MPLPLTTRQAAALIGISYWRLYGLLRSGVIAEPQRNGAGDFAWLPPDVEAARSAVERHLAPRRRTAAGV